MDRLDELDWVPRFWHNALLQLGARSYPPSLAEIQDLQVNVTERLASGNVVVQKEVWSGRPVGDERVRRFEALGSCPA